MVAAEGKDEVPGLLLLSYPLHPPNKPEQLRTAHFGDIQVPCLFVQGTSDPFGTPDEVNTAISEIHSRTQAFYLDGLGHDLGKGKPEVVDRVSEEFRRFMMQ
jgi:predicted alpha/beta-hydrolase family hydrolase